MVVVGRWWWVMDGVWRGGWWVLGGGGRGSAPAYNLAAAGDFSELKRRTVDGGWWLVSNLDGL